MKSDIDTLKSKGQRYEEVNTKVRELEKENQGVKTKAELTEDQIKMEEAVFLQGFSMKEKYPVLYAWAVDVSETHKVDYSLFEE